MSEWLSKENECKNIGPWSEGGAEAMLSLLLVFCLFFFFFLDVVLMSKKKFQKVRIRELGLPWALLLLLPKELEHV